MRTRSSAHRPAPARRRVAARLAPAACLAGLALLSSGCGSLIYNCKANDTQCKEKVAAMDKATADIALDVTTAAIEASAHADDGKERAPDPPPPASAACPAPASAVAARPPPAPPASPSGSGRASGASSAETSGDAELDADGAVGAATGTGDPFDAAGTLRELHVALHFARLCRGDSVGAVSGKVMLDPRGFARAARLVGPGVKSPAVMACVKGRIESATIKPFAGRSHTANVVFDVDPDEDLPTPKEPDPPAAKGRARS